MLAERYNVELQLEDEDPRAEERRRRRERLLELLDRTARFYAVYLWEAAGGGQGARVPRWPRAVRGDAARVPRRLRAERLGQRHGQGARARLQARGADGGRSRAWSRASDRGGLYDRFRGRIMFPLADARGRVLGFGARAMGEGRGPKYLNTSENELYHKGRQLFGIDLARRPAAKSGRIVVVEGYTDVLALHQAGIPETVAIMGTALTQEQLAELGRGRLAGRAGPRRRPLGPGGDAAGGARGAREAARAAGGRDARAGRRPRRPDRERGGRGLRAARLPVQSRWSGFSCVG